ncbi:MAG: M28 family peptidase, partial [Planctomycetaceae bacterium]|nr:M28 family peptidase [Planctomycetaceae bacterium]
MRLSPIPPRAALVNQTRTDCLDAAPTDGVPGGAKPLPKAGIRRFAPFTLVAAGLAAAVLAACATPKKDDAANATPAAAASANAESGTASAPPASAAGDPARATPNAAAGTAANASAKPATSVRPSTPKTGAGLFSDVTQPGKGTPKPRERASTARGEGKIIPGSVNVYTFDPAESFVPVDPMSTSLAQVLADLGPDAVEWYQHVQTLSNPWFEGRVPGSDGIERAAEYCEFWMEKAGLEPAFASGAQANPADPWRQPFALPGRERSITSSAILLGGAQVEGSTKAMRNSGGGTAELPVTFVGYGIENGKDGYTNFAPDARFEGRIVLVMRGEPLDAEGKSRWGGDKFTSASSLAAKIDAIRRRGANGIVVIEPPGYGGKKANLATMSAESLGGTLGVPCFFADGPAAEALVKACDADGRDLAALRNVFDEGTKDAPALPIAFKDDAPVTLKVDVDTGEMTTHNVGGILGGRGDLKDEWIVIGAHYDHVGYGMYGADPANRGKVHPGADDNASGTSGMLVLAKRLAKSYADAPADANLRSVLFLAFSAEEMGLNGSRAYVKSPSIPADKVDIMLNMDMIGRMRSGELVVGGVESAEGFSEKLEPFFKKSGLTIYADPSGRGPSDHSSFFGAGIPVLFFFSGVHDIYHKPGDVGYTVDPRGVPAILDLVQSITMWRAASPERLAFQNGAPRPQRPTVVDTAPGGNDRGYAPVRLGIQPGMTEDGESGILVESVSPNTSASDAGIKPGDILL